MAFGSRWVPASPDSIAPPLHSPSRAQCATRKHAVLERNATYVLNLRVLPATMAGLGLGLGLDGYASETDQDDVDEARGVPDSEEPGAHFIAALRLCA